MFAMCTSAIAGPNGSGRLPHSDHLPRSDGTTLHLTSPYLTSPHLTSPHLTSPHLAPPPPDQARAGRFRCTVLVPHV
ncbi:MAG: hypothetical protein ACOC0P_04010 [Planctomycetota bacterium]